MAGLVAENLKGEIEDEEVEEEEAQEFDDDDDEFGILMHGIEDATDIFSFCLGEAFPPLNLLCNQLVCMDNGGKWGGIEKK